MKKFFNTKSIRERVLMAAFLLIAVVTWGSSLLGRTRLVQFDYTATHAELTDQLTWLQNKSQVEERTKKATTQLDPSRTLNATQAFAEVNRLAVAQGIQLDMGAVRTVGKDSNFEIHMLQATIRQTAPESQLRFYRELSAKFPYLGIESFSFSTDRGAPGRITVALRVYSVEVVTPATKS